MRYRIDRGEWSGPLNKRTLTYHPVAWTDTYGAARDVLDALNTAHRLISFTITDTEFTRQGDPALPQATRLAQQLSASERCVSRLGDQVKALQITLEEQVATIQRQQDFNASQAIKIVGLSTDRDAVVLGRDLEGSQDQRYLIGFDDHFLPPLQ